jgi:hypothetical protein
MADRLAMDKNDLESVLKALREVRLPALAAGVDDDIEDINLSGWRQ